jgi:quinone-modifying oxidoreductase subunit QmoA
MSNNSILVVGGGFAGITAALEAAEVGYEVYIVETNPYLGGRVAQLNQYFPKLCPPSCGLEIQFQRIKNTPNVKVITMAEVTSVSGSAGNYDVKITQRPRYVNEKCTSCGDCEKVCTTKVESEFDFGIGTRKVAYKTHPFMFPMRYVIDADNASESELAAIKDACTYDAVNLDDAPKTIELAVGAIVVSTGWKPYDVSNLTNLGGGTLKNVVTNMQFERLAAPSGPTNGKILRPSDSVEPKKIAFVQCAGSRDQNHLNYCSYICCMASLKHVRYIRERSDANVTVYYIDLRTPGRYDKFKAITETDEKLSLVKGKVADIVEDANGNPIVTVENALTGIKTEEKFDMVVLATGMEPSAAGHHVLACSTDTDGFVIDGEGIIAAGCAKQPLDVMKSAQSGTAAAMKAIQTVVGR